MNGLDFEEPILKLERRIGDLKKYAVEQGVDLNNEIETLEIRQRSLTREIFSKLTAWQRVQLARHPNRPYALDYVERITSDFVELHGDRLFSDDKSIVGGFGTVEGIKLLLVGHQKGRTTEEKMARNFGMAHPEGYRKAMRLMRLAEKFAMPVVTFIDTPGAYPGIGAEERGQAQAIASNLRDMAALRVPVVTFVIGEGGSGGALGIGVADRIFVLENAYYSVIPPEGCAAILWRNREKTPDAAEALKITGDDLMRLGVIDAVVPEPPGGAHRGFDETARNVKEHLVKALAELTVMPVSQLLKSRYEKFRRMGVFMESTGQAVAGGQGV